MYHFKAKGECDFATIVHGKAEELIQVCDHLDDLNFQIEYSGLIDAMKFSQKKEGAIVTINQKDLFEKDGFVVKLIPAHEYLA